MKYFYYISVAVMLAAFIFTFAPQPASAELNVLQPRGESKWATGDNDGIRDYVEDVFGNNHIMVDVARCESGFRQYYSGGDVLIAGDSNAVGVFQLLEVWHEQAAEDRGHSIYTVEGNVGYAQELYEEEGLKPWSPSSLCWDDGRVSETDVDGSSSNESSRTPMLVRSGDPSSNTAEDDKEEESEEKNSDDEPDEDTDRDRHLLGQSGSSDTEEADRDVPELISKKLIIGVHDAQVVELQKLLNRIGYRLTTNGPGSPGEETNYFGSLTKQALQKFQCDNNIICDGVEYTTGYGMTDAKTRVTLNKEAADTPGQRTSNRVQMQVRSDSDRNSDNTSTNNESERDGMIAQIDELTRRIADLRAQLSQ